MDLIQSYTASQVLAYYSNHASKSYQRVAKQFLSYCESNRFAINELSYNEFIAGKSGSMKSQTKKFYKFVCDNKFYNINYDLEKGPPSQNALILIFISSYDGIKSKDSETTYKNALNAYANFCCVNSYDFVSSLSLKRYRDHLSIQLKASNTINTYISAVRSMATFFIRNKERLEGHEINYHEMQDMTMIVNVNTNNQEGYSKESLNEEQREHLMMHISDLKSKLIISVMAYEGLRRNEVTYLQFGDFSIENGTLMVRGKGNMNQKVKVRLFRNTERLLQNYLMQLSYNPEPSDLIFPNLSASSVYEIAMNSFELAGLTKPGLTTHSLRHTALQVLKTKGVAEEYIQMQARHKDIKSTRVYTKKAISASFLDNLPRDLFS